MPKPKKNPRVGRKLYDLRVAEVSLVDFGANEKQFLVTKRKDKKSMGKGHEKVAKRLANLTDSERKLVQKAAATALKPLLERIKKLGEDDSEEPMSEQLQATLASVARLILPYKDQLTKDDLLSLAEEVGIEDAPDDSEDEDDLEDDEEVSKNAGEDGSSEDSDADDDASDSDSDDDDDTDEDSEEEESEEKEIIEDEVVQKVGAESLTTEAPDGVSKEEHEAALQAAKLAYTSILEKSGYNKDEQADNKKDAEPVTKNKSDLSAFPKAQRRQMQRIFKAQKQLADANAVLIKKNASLQTEIESERVARLERQFEEQASAYAALGIDTKKISKIFKKLGGDPKQKETLDEVVGILKAANEQLEQSREFGGLYSEHGSRLGNSGDAASDEAALDRLAEEIVKKSAGEMTHAKAYDKVLQTKEGRKLYAKSEGRKNRGQ